eukprot:1115061-Rhodomonas_salina.1
MAAGGDVIGAAGDEQGARDAPARQDLWLPLQCGAGPGRDGDVECVCVQHDEREPPLRPHRRQPRRRAHDGRDLRLPPQAHQHAHRAD